MDKQKAIQEVAKGFAGLVGRMDKSYGELFHKEIDPKDTDKSYQNQKNNKNY